MTTIVDLLERKYREKQRGPLYRCFIGDEVLLESARDPEHECARELSKRGITGRVQFRTQGSTTIRSTHLIAVAATLTTVESNKHGLQIKKWKPHFKQKEKNDD